jgi:hypothetical protein
MDSTPLAARLEQAVQLLARLERVSADSVWAHRSSGYRGSLLKWIDRAEKLSAAGRPISSEHMAHFERLQSIGLDMLAQAARERLSKRNYRV